MPVHLQFYSSMSHQTRPWTCRGYWCSRLLCAAPQGMTVLCGPLMLLIPSYHQAAEHPLEQLVSEGTRSVLRSGWTWKQSQQCEERKRKEISCPKSKLHHSVVAETISDSSCAPAAERAKTKSMTQTLPGKEQTKLSGSTLTFASSKAKAAKTVWEQQSACTTCTTVWGNLKHKRACAWLPI